MLGHQFPVHNLGHVRVIDYMGDDNAIVQMARVSYGEGTKTVNEDRGLIRYLMAHRHTSPFEGCVVKLHLKMPIFVARQWVRHRTASMNEYSGRYSEMKDECYLPDLDYILAQSKTNKQGSAGELDQEFKERFREVFENDQKEIFSHYKEAIVMDVAREMARINLPLSTYTEFYWQMNLHNLLHFCSLRSDPHAQREIRDFSDIILHEIIKAWVPHTYEAFMEYVMNAQSFSATELSIMKDMLAGEVYEPQQLPSWANLSKREQEAFLKKVAKT